MRSAISGLSVTSIKFKCEARQPRFTAGQRVRFGWTIYPDDEDSEVYETTFDGTVIREKRGNLRFIVRVDQTGKYYDFEPKYVFKSDVISVRPDHMAALNEPRILFCPECFKYTGEEGRCHANPSSDYLDNYIPKGCLEHKA